MAGAADDYCQRHRPTPRRTLAHDGAPAHGMASYKYDDTYNFTSPLPHIRLSFTRRSRRCLICAILFPARDAPFLFYDSYSVYFISATLALAPSHSSSHAPFSSLSYHHRHRLHHGAPRLSLRFPASHRMLDIYFDFAGHFFST